MSLRDDFLEDVHIGTNVNIVCGLSGTMKVSGKVFAISETSVKIQTRDNRKISIAIDSIIAYEEQNDDLGNLQENNNKADSQVLVCNEPPDNSDVKETITPKNWKRPIIKINDSYEKRPIVKINDSYSDAKETVPSGKPKFKVRIKDPYSDSWNGVIISFDNNRLFGIINGGTNQIFFHINQVSDNRVRKLLCENITSIKVQYKLGAGQKHTERREAYDIQLVRPDKIGEIVSFDNSAQTGCVESENVKYTFTLEKDVCDPILKCCLENGLLNFPIEVKVDIETPFFGDKSFSNIELANIDTAVSIVRKTNHYTDAMETWGKILSEDFETATGYSPLKPFDSSWKPNQDCFDIANKADVVEKKTDKAIFYYNEAIKNGGKKLSSSVLNLALIYSRQFEMQKALELLDKYKDAIEDAGSYWNTKLQILLKNPSKDYKDQIKTAFTEAEKHKKTTQQLHHLMNEKARVLFILEEYQESREIYETLLESSNTDDRQKAYYLTQLCKLSVALNDMSTAIVYANRILQVASDNKLAHEVLDGTIGPDTIGKMELIEDDFYSSTVISDFIIDNVNHINLETEVKEKYANLFEGDQFIETEESAKKLFDEFLCVTKNQMTESDKVMSQKQYMKAKIISQVLERQNIENPKIFNESSYRYCIAYGTMYYANTRLYEISFEQPKNYDTARFCYLESAKIFNEAEKIYYCWYCSILSFYKSFSTNNPASIKKMEDLSSPHSESFKKQLNDILKETEFEKAQGFLFGVFESLEYDGKYDNLIKDCLLQNEEFVQLISPDNNLGDDGATQLEDFILYFKKCKKDMQSTLIKLCDNISNLGQFELLCESLRQNQLIDYFNATDSEYWQLFQNILSLIHEYNETSDSGQKIEYLTDINERLIELEREIHQSPTRFSYDLLLKTIADPFESKLRIAANDLYAHSIPEITISEPEEVSINDDTKMCGFSLSYTNKENKNAATNVTIEIASSASDIHIISGNETERISFLKGDGKPLSKYYQIKLPENIAARKLISFQVKVCYSYKENMDCEASDSVGKQFSIDATTNEFYEIENKFKRYSSGNPIINKDMFFGRKQEIEDITNGILSNTSESTCVVLYGQKRTGKSSILNQVENFFRELKLNRIIVVNFGSIGPTGINADNIKGFLFELLNKIWNEIKYNHKELYLTLCEKGFELSKDFLGRILFNHDDVIGQTLFNDKFEELSHLLHDIIENYKIVLMLDEFTYVYDKIRDGSMTPNFMRFWKGFLQNNHNLYCILVGQDYMPKFINEYKNEFGAVKTKRITYLPKRDAEELMIKPIRFPKTGENRYREGVVDYLYKLTSGSACLLMRICSDLVDCINTEIKSNYISMAHVKDHFLKHFLEEIDEGIFDPLYSDDSEHSSDKQAAETNKVYLKKVAQACGNNDWCQIDSVFKTPDEKVVMKNLYDRDVLEIKKGRSCRIKVALYKEWLLYMYGYGD